MTTDSDIRPLLVLGLGNLLLEDDGVGIELLRRVQERCRDERIDFVDGGTQGIALGALLAGRQAVLILDAVRLGDEPGTVHHLRDALALAPPRGDSAHGANAGELLATAMLIGDLPDRVEVIGIESASTRTGIGLSPVVIEGLPTAVTTTASAIETLLGRLAGAPPPCAKPS